MEPKQTKVALVTGASSGIGKATVLRLLAEGYVVHAAARRLEAMAELGQRGAYVHHLDLTKPESISACAAAVLERNGRIDVLVNNAGYGAYGAIEDVPASVARDQMDVNLFGLAQMIAATLPPMRAQRAGRIINVTSIGGKIWSPFGGWYHASKFAVEGLSDALRYEVRPFGIDVVVVEPGGVKTEWGGIAVKNLLETSGDGPYGQAAHSAAHLYSTDVGAAMPEDIANVIARAASARRPKIRYVAPLSGRVILWLRWGLNDRAFDWLIGRVVTLTTPRTPDGSVPADSQPRPSMKPAQP